jgi:hypothetical protein
MDTVTNLDTDYDCDNDTSVSPGQEMDSSVQSALEQNREYDIAQSM